MDGLKNYKTMLKCFVILVIIFSFQRQLTHLATVAIDKRISMLRDKIKAEIKEEQRRVTLKMMPAIQDYDQYYVTEVDDSPIKPVLQYTEKKRKRNNKNKTTTIKNKFRAKIRRTRTTRTTTTRPTTTTTVRTRSTKITPADVYYRRDSPIQWSYSDGTTNIDGYNAPAAASIGVPDKDPDSSSSAI